MGVFVQSFSYINRLIMKYLLHSGHILTMMIVLHNYEVLFIFCLSSCSVNQINICVCVQVCMCRHAFIHVCIEILSYWISIIFRVIFIGLINAIAWPASLITLASVIDNPWGVCCRRSAEVGKQLAEVLLSREQGQRPVTLIGFSLGARVIYYCLRVRMLKPSSLQCIHRFVFRKCLVHISDGTLVILRHFVVFSVIPGKCKDITFDRPKLLPSISFSSNHSQLYYQYCVAKDTDSIAK